MVGVGFSGKSTLAKQIVEYKNAVLVSQDDLWFEKEKEWDLSLDSDEDWDRVLQISKQRVRENLAEGESVVFDHVNLRHNHREELINMAKSYNARAVIIYLDTPIDIQKERQIKNKETKERHDVKQEELDDAIKELEIPEESENVFVFKPETNLESFLERLPQ